MENNLAVFQNIKHRFPTRLSDSTPGYIHKRLKTVDQTKTCTGLFIAALSRIAKNWKQPKMPMTDEWVSKM